MTDKPRLLDLFSGAGGAGMGYFRAGFEVVGIDNRPQPRYPFAFHQADALEYVAEHGHEFDAIHASPPCQFGSVLTPMAHRSKHKNLIPQTRQLLKQSGKPYIIENVENCRRHLHNPIMLCGSTFGIDVWRHRYFEIHPELGILITPCQHDNIPVLISGSPRRNGSRKEPNAETRRLAMDTPWMTIAEMDQAIPPAYCEFIGKQLIRCIDRRRNYEQV